MSSPASSAVRVAVVIPCFNDGATLGDALASLRDQEPHELVVVDDGSDDEPTLVRLRELQAQGVRVIRQANAGPGAARMAAVAATTARYVYPLDADDELAPGALTRLADALDADERAAVAYGDVEVFGDTQRVSCKRDVQLDPWLLTYINTVPGLSMVRRQALRATGGWQLRGGYEDWDLWMACAERGLRGVYADGGVVFRYRTGGTRRWKADMQRHDRLYALLRERHPSLFAGRRANRRRSSAPLRGKLLFPLIDRLPGLSASDKQRLYHAIHRPGLVVRYRLRGLRSGRSAIGASA